MSIDRRRWLKAKLEVAPHPAYRLRKLRLYVSAPSTITHTHRHRPIARERGGDINRVSPAITVIHIVIITYHILASITHIAS
jgi:hypothetical protein